MLAIIILSALFYLLWAIVKSPSSPLKYSVYVAWTLHAYVCYGILIGENGWIINSVNAVLLVSWLSVWVVMLLHINSYWIKVPLIFFAIFSLILADSNPLNAEQEYYQFSWQLNLHIGLSMLAYSILSVAMLFAISLWVHIRKIKSSEFDSHTSLISLLDEEKKLTQIIVIGWLILSTSLITGVIFVDGFIQHHIGHKVVFSLMAWLIFGSLIIGRLTNGWRGEKLISLTITGMTLLAVGYLGSKIVFEWIIN